MMVPEKDVVILAPEIERWLEFGCWSYKICIIKHFIRMIIPVKNVKIFKTLKINNNIIFRNLWKATIKKCFGYILICMLASLIFGKVSFYVEDTKMKQQNGGENIEGHSHQ